MIFLVEGVDVLRRHLAVAARRVHRKPDAHGGGHHAVLLGLRHTAAAVRRAVVDVRKIHVHSGRVGAQIQRGFVVVLLLGLTQPKGTGPQPAQPGAGAFKPHRFLEPGAHIIGGHRREDSHKGLPRTAVRVQRGGALIFAVPLVGNLQIDGGARRQLDLGGVGAGIVDVPREGGRRRGREGNQQRRKRKRQLTAQLPHPPRPMVHRQPVFLPAASCFLLLYHSIFLFHGGVPKNGKIRLIVIISVTLCLVKKAESSADSGKWC